jgi:hypothetical protein
MNSQSWRFDYSEGCVKVGVRSPEVKDFRETAQHGGSGSLESLDIEASIK